MEPLPSLIRNADAALASLDAALAELAKPLPGVKVNRKRAALSKINEAA